MTRMFFVIRKHFFAISSRERVYELRVLPLHRAPSNSSRTEPSPSPQHGGERQCRTPRACAGRGILRIQHAMALFASVSGAGRAPHCRNSQSRSLGWPHRQCLGPAVDVGLRNLSYAPHSSRRSTYVDNNVPSASAFPVIIALDRCLRSIAHPQLASRQVRSRTFLNIFPAGAFPRPRRGHRVPMSRTHFKVLAKSPTLTR